jgi:aspartate/methionine/tyrosine aminotransferase
MFQNVQMQCTEFILNISSFFAFALIEPESHAFPFFTGAYMVVDVTGIPLSTTEIAQVLLEEGSVSVINGEEFGQSGAGKLVFTISCSKDLMDGMIMGVEECLGGLSYDMLGD